jgi:hypothetical protein
MPKITLPIKNKNWDISYESDNASSLIETFNTDFHTYPNKIITSAKFISSLTSSSMRPSTDFVVASITDQGGYSSTYYVFAICEKIYKAIAGLISFSQDTLTNSPTNILDGDAVTTGKGLYGYDILVVSSSNSDNLYRFNYDVSQTDWNPYWWTGQRFTINSISATNPVQITLSTSSHGISDNDLVVIRNSSVSGLNSPQNSVRAFKVTSVSGPIIVVDYNNTGGSTSGGGTVALVYDDSSSIKYPSLGQYPLKTGVPHPMETFGNGPVLFIGDDNLVHSIARPYVLDNGNAVQSSYLDVKYGRLQLKSDYQVNWIKATSSYVFIGARNKKGDSYQSVIEIYDPYTEQIREVEIQEGSTSAVILDNNLFIIDKRWNIRYWNGNSFQIVYKLRDSNIYSGTRDIPHRNGMVGYDNKIFFAVSNTSLKYYGGVYVYDTQNSRAYHFSSPITDNGRQAGISKLWCYALSFVGNVFYLGSDISTISGLNIKGIFHNAGIQYRNTSSTVRNVSRIVTGKIYSGEIDTYFRNILIKYNPKLNYQSDDIPKIIVKYRNEDDYRKYNYTIEGYWLNNYQIFLNTDYLNGILEVGDEVEVLEGYGAGFSAHVSSISYSSGTTTITLNENLECPYSLTGGWLTARFSNWKRFPESSDIIVNGTSDWALIDIPQDYPKQWIQFKIEIRGYVPIEEIQIGYQSNLIQEV